MTTVSTIDRTAAVANGTTPIPFTFQALSADEVGVLRANVPQFGTYTVNLNGDGTGTITPSTDWGSDAVLVFSDPSFTQPSDFLRFGPFYPDQVTNALDRQARATISLKNRLDASAPDATLRTDLAATGGAGLISYDPAGTYAIGTLGRKVQEVGIPSPNDYGADPSGVTNSTPAFAALVAATVVMAVPLGDYNLYTNVSLSGPLSFDQNPNTTYTGAGELQTPDLFGFTHVTDISEISLVRSRGTLSSPTTSVQPVALIHKNSLTTDIGGGINSAFTAIHNHYGTVGEAKAHAGFFETIVRTGGAGIFGEGIRAHGIVPAGIVGKSYGAVFYAMNAGAGLNTIGVEAEVRRITAASDNGNGRTWDGIVGGGRLDGCFNASCHTAEGTVGGTGGKPASAFYVNMFNTQSVQTGFWVPKSYVGGKTVEHTAFGCQELGLSYGLDLAKGSYTVAAVALPFDTPITSYNVGSAAEVEIVRLIAGNILRLGNGGSGVKLHGTVSFGAWTTNADAAVNGYISITDEAGTARKLATIA